MYDSFGNTDYILADDAKIVDYTYNSNNGKLNTITYGNGFTERYVYDALDRISEIGIMVSRDTSIPMT